MKICFVITRFPGINFWKGEKGFSRYQIAGGEKYAFYLAQELDKLGEDVFVITSNYDEGEKTECYNNVQVLRRKPLFSFRMAFVTPGILRHLLKFSKERYDLIHAHFTEPPTADFAAINCRINGTPLVLTYHGAVSETYGTIFRRILATLYNKILLKSTLEVASKIIISSESLIEENKMLSKLSEKIAIIPPGVDLQKFSVNSNKQKCRTELNINQERRVILYVGTLSEYKGIIYLLKSIRLLMKKYKDIVLIIGGEGRQKFILQSETKKLHLVNNVEFRGFIPENQLSEYYQAADVFVLPSVGAPESFGLVLLEAMATETPVIATNIPGVRSLVKNGENGILVNPKDACGLARAISTIIDDKGLSKKLGIRGRRLVEERFSWEANARKTLQVYRNVLSSSRKGTIKREAG